MTVRIFRLIQQMSGMDMELLTIWDLKRSVVRIVTIIRADVMIVFLYTAKNVPNMKNNKM